MRIDVRYSVKNYSHTLNIKLLFIIILTFSTLTYMDLSSLANILHDPPQDTITWCKLEGFDPLVFPFGIVVLSVSLELMQCYGQPGVEKRFCIYYINQLYWYTSSAIEVIILPLVATITLMSAFCT